MDEPRTKHPLARAELDEELRALRDHTDSVASAHSPEGSVGSGLADFDERFRFVLEHLRAMFVEVDADNAVVYLSPTVTEILGYAPEDLRGRQGIDWVHPDDLPKLSELARRLRETGELAPVVYRSRHKNGHWVWLETFSARSFRAEDGSIHNVTFSRDVSDEKRASDALRESEERHRIVAETALDIISELDEKGRNVYASPTTVDILGYSSEELRGANVFELVHPEDRKRMREIFASLASGEPRTAAPYRVRHRDGHWVWLEGTSLAYRRADGRQHFLTVSRDVSERRRFEERMQQAQKLEGLGVMAGGIAHDFNNLLTPILGDASLALLDLPPDSPVRARLEKIQKAAQRAAALTSQMLAYAGAESRHVEPLNLSRLVEEMAELLEGAVSGAAVVRYALAPELPAIEADAGQLSQVVMNLVTNAFEAVGSGRGRIELSTGTFDAGSGAALATALGEDLCEGRYVFFEVVDDGCGMDAATRARIFDPFFTTKFTGRGLGLAAVLGIVRGHRGSIEIESEPGRGTRFRVLFPACGDPPAAAASAEPPPDDWRTAGCVLVIDDDPGVRELVRDTLERTGLAVLAAPDGRRGVELFRAHREEIRAVILDRTMPATSGAEAFEAIRGLPSDVPILLLSGYAEEHAVEPLAGRGLAGFLRKPFLPRDLLSRVRGMLEA